MRICLVLLICFALLFTGCASYVQHLGRSDHPFHAVPAYIGFGIGYISFIPFMVLEEVITGNGGPFSPPQVFGRAGSCFGNGLACILATPFYILGYPLEPSDPGPGSGSPPPVPPEFREAESPAATPQE